MNACIRGVVAFGLVAFLLPLLAAQDEPKDPKPEVPKEAPKKKAVPQVDPNVLASAPKFLAKIQDVMTENDVKEVVVVLTDPQKVQEFERWKLKTVSDIRSTRGDPRPKIEKYKKDLPGKVDAIFSGETKTVVVTDRMRVRTAEPPPQYDAAGNVRKLTASELARLRGTSSRLPGYTADFSALKAGQLVEVTIPRTAPTPTAKAPPPPANKKILLGVDPTLNVATGGAKIDAYMIYVLPE